MQVSVVSRKLVKPCTPTPQNLRSYNISFIDELVPMPNLCAVLYYEPSSFQNKDISLIQQTLEESLSRILPDFYPLAGRYVKNERIVDCSDQGAQFIVAEASPDVTLVKMMSSKQHLDDLLLPRGYGSSDGEAGEPLLSLQVTQLGCGGIAVTINISHRIFDGSSFATFISYWANATRGSQMVPPDQQNNATASRPKFNASSVFPPKKFPIPKEARNLKLLLRRFLFDREAITALRTKHGSTSTGGGEEVGNGTISKNVRPVSRVLVVSALITRALIRVDREIKGRSRDSTISQLVNLRPRTVPPLPEDTCGNIVTVASTPRIPATNAEHMEFRELASLTKSAVEKTLLDCKEILSQGVAGHAIVVDSWVGFEKAVFGGELNACWFSDFSKFGFYEIDFGWGKPAWASAGSLDLPNGALLMADREGSGIEAWVHLDKKSMSAFEQDEEIKLFAK